MTGLFRGAASGAARLAWRRGHPRRERPAGPSCPRPGRPVRRAGAGAAPWPEPRHRRSSPSRRAARRRGGFSLVQMEESPVGGPGQEDASWLRVMPSELRSQGSPADPSLGFSMVLCAVPRSHFVRILLKLRQKESPNHPYPPQKNTPKITRVKKIIPQYPSLKPNKNTPSAWYSLPRTGALPTRRERVKARALNRAKHCRK